MKMNDTKIERSDKVLSVFGGLLFFKNLMDRLGVAGELGKILPRKNRNLGHSSSVKFCIGILTFIAGGECIDDLNWFRRDPMFRHVCEGVVPPTTMSDFLKTFSLKHFEKLETLLLSMANNLRQLLFPNDNKIIISMDATDTKQFGKKMEGVEFNYKKFFGFSSQNAFDQYGFCYGWTLRGGATHTSKGAVEMIERVFKSIRKGKEKYFRADSGYESRDIYNTLLMNNVNFAIALKENSWRPLLEKNIYSIKWEKTKLKFFDSDKCQVASCPYLIKDLYGGRSYLRVVFIRGRKKSEDPMNYYAMVTSMSEIDMKDEKIIEFYRDRSNAENYIKDMKYGLDFKHFSCRKLNKNRAWGTMGVFAYNLLRYAAWKIFPATGCFIQTTRKKMVFLACEVVRHARVTKLRFSKNFFKEVQRLENIFIRSYGLIIRSPEPNASG